MIDSSALMCYFVKKSKAMTEKSNAAVRHRERGTGESPARRPHERTLPSCELNALCAVGRGGK